MPEQPRSAQVQGQGCPQMNGATREGADGTPIPPFPSGFGGRRTEEKRRDQGLGIWEPRRSRSSSSLAPGSFSIASRSPVTELPTATGLGGKDPSFGILRWTLTAPWREAGTGTGRMPSPPRLFQLKRPGLSPSPPFGAGWRELSPPLNRLGFGTPRLGLVKQSRCNHGLQFQRSRFRLSRFIAEAVFTSGRSFS